MKFLVKVCRLVDQDLAISALGQESQPIHWSDSHFKLRLLHHVNPSGKVNNMPGNSKEICGLKINSYTG